MTRGFVTWRGRGEVIISILLTYIVLCACRSNVELVGELSDCAVHNPYSKVVNAPVAQERLNSTVTGLNQSIILWYPEVEGSYSVMTFIGGLGGDVFVVWYSDFLTTIASNGVIVIGIDLFPNLASNYHFQSQQMIEVINWAQSNLNTVLAELSDNTVTALTFHMVGSAHSSGNQAVLQTYLSNPGLLTAIAFIDPVDIELNPVIPENTTLSDSSGFPVLVIASGLGPVPGINITGWPPCCPPGWSSMHFYSAFEGPKWYINATLYGHADILNPVFAEAAKITHFCAAHAEGNLPLEYRDLAGGAVSSFINLMEMNECSCQNYLQNADLMPTEVDLQSSLGSWVCYD